MKKILVISWFYPPINSSEGLVTYKLLRNSKLQYDVCMQESNASWSYGNKEYLPECENVRKIPIQADTLEIWKNKTIEYFNAHKKEYDIIMTRSMPPESHEIGLKIKEIKPEIKWIASFGDPIANNPFVLKTINKTKGQENRPVCLPFLDTMIAEKTKKSSFLFLCGPKGEEV